MIYVKNRSVGVSFNGFIIIFFIFQCDQCKPLTPNAVYIYLSDQSLQMSLVRPRLDKFKSLI